MRLLMRYILIFLLVFFGFQSNAQRVGVVLSGGGATAMAHIGFLRTLEEHNIPIDYIAGTSMGAVIAAFYASGYSIDEMEAICTSKEFVMMSEGQLPEELKFYYLNDDPNAALVNLKYSGGEHLSNAIPTNLIDPSFVDWFHMQSLSSANALARENFDSLFVPFRCVAADVTNQRQIVFKSGPLNEAVRASSTYPFYIPPRKVNGDLLYDGGIYNNFPVDVMYREFMPDVILGSDVSGGNKSPDPDNLISQLRALIITRSEQDIPCPELFVIHPNVQGVSTFDFEKASVAIQTGAQETNSHISEIESLITRRVERSEVEARRSAFRKKCPVIEVDEIQLEGIGRGQKAYINELLGKKKEGQFSLEEMRKSYFRVIADDGIQGIYPIAKYKPATNSFLLKLDVKKEKDLFVSFGGNFSSRNISTGFVDFKYHLFGRVNTSLELNSYYGRYYASLMFKARWRFNLFNLPLSTELSYVQNRYDYYKSLATYFEDLKPSYVLLNERFGQYSLLSPAGRRGKIRFDEIYTYQFDRYYQTKNFLSTDTADMTQFEAVISRLSYERNTLNRIQYASSGTLVRLSAKGVWGWENTIPGSTSLNRDTTHTFHSWYTVRGYYENYFLQLKRFTLGGRAEGVYSSLPRFQNYVATVLNSPTLTSFQEFQTLYLPTYRSPAFVSMSFSGILHVSKKVDLRTDWYAFHPFYRIEKGVDGSAEYIKDYKSYTLASASVIFHSPIGPASISANYYEMKENPWSILFNLGLVISNPSPRN